MDCKALPTQCPAGLADATVALLMPALELSAQSIGRRMHQS